MVTGRTPPGGCGRPVGCRPVAARVLEVAMIFTGVESAAANPDGPRSSSRCRIPSRQFAWLRRAGNQIGCVAGEMAVRGPSHDGPDPVDVEVDRGDRTVGLIPKQERLQIRRRAPGRRRPGEDPPVGDDDHGLVTSPRQGEPEPVSHPLAQLPLVLTAGKPSVCVAATPGVQDRLELLPQVRGGSPTLQVAYVQLPELVNNMHRQSVHRSDNFGRLNRSKQWRAEDRSDRLRCECPRRLPGLQDALACERVVDTPTGELLGQVRPTFPVTQQQHPVHGVIVAADVPMDNRSSPTAPARTGCSLPG